MKLSQPKEHVCKYWYTSVRIPLRWCKYCKRYQYRYTGEWKDEITFTRFIELWTCAMGNGELDLRIDIANPFEAYSYESWDVVYYVEFLSGEYKGKRFGHFENWNQADATLQKAGLKHYSERTS